METYYGMHSRVHSVADEDDEEKAEEESDEEDDAALHVAVKAAGAGLARRLLKIRLLEARIACRATDERLQQLQSMEDGETQHMLDEPVSSTGDFG